MGKSVHDVRVIGEAVKYCRDERGRFSARRRRTRRRAMAFVILAFLMAVVADIARGSLTSEKYTFVNLAASAELPIAPYEWTVEEGEMTSYDPCGLKDVVCENEKPIAKTEVERLIVEAFPEDPRTALAVAKAESGLVADRVGDTHIEFTRDGVTMGHSCGLFQVRVLPGRPDCETLKDARTNIAFARKLWEKSGWSPWSAWKNGSFKKFM